MNLLESKEEREKNAYFHSMNSYTFKRPSSLSSQATNGKQVKTQQRPRKQSGLFDLNNTTAKAKAFFSNHTHDMKERCGPGENGCAICEAQIQDADKYTDKFTRNMKYYTKDTCTFSKFMSYLQPPSIDLEGCEVIFPDSLFFQEDGKPDYWGKTDYNGKFMSIRNQNKLGLSDIRSKFAVIARGRQEETRTFAQRLTDKLNSKSKNTEDGDKNASSLNTPTETQSNLNKTLSSPKKK